MVIAQLQMFSDTDVKLRWENMSRSATKYLVLERKQTYLEHRLLAHAATVDPHTLECYRRRLGQRMDDLLNRRQ